MKKSKDKTTTDKSEQIDKLTNLRSRESSLEGSIMNQFPVSSISQDVTNDYIENDKHMQI